MARLWKHVVFLQEFVAIPSPATQKESSSRLSEDERNKAYSVESIGRPTSPRTSVFLEAIFSRNGRKINKISSKKIIVAMAKETIGFRPDDSISAYNGGKLNFPWSTENLNFAPRMRMLNWRPSPFNAKFEPDSDKADKSAKLCTQFPWDMSIKSEMGAQEKKTSFYRIKWEILFGIVLLCLVTTRFLKIVFATVLKGKMA